MFVRYTGAERNSGTTWLIRSPVLKWLWLRDTTIEKTFGLLLLHSANHPNNKETSRMYHVFINQNDVRSILTALSREAQKKPDEVRPFIQGLREELGSLLACIANEGASNNPTKVAE
ncbi:MAG: hypothetical protein ACREDR_26005 [Blastocatellia bacterium]